MQLNDYPFSAIVGQQAMKTALLLNAVDPSIGGVLIRGQKGTAKSTTARALANLLPAIEAVVGCPYHCSGERPERMHDGCLERFDAGESLPVETVPTPLVELPLGATEDRLAGSFDLDKTLKTGRRHFEPGLLAAANRGILYVDEVNLLEDHLVDLLLDAAASGVNRVEREGFQLAHPARFVLIGTMNPEEGELRPQFLDRFGLVASVAGLTDRQLRRQLVEYRLRFEQDPAGFAEEWAPEEAFLARQIATAQQALGAMVLPSQTVQLAADLALQSNVQGHRAEIILVKAARALAALMGKEQVEERDIREVACFALPHRLPEGLSADAAHQQETLRAALDNGGSEGRPGRLGDKDGGEEDFYAGEFPGAAAAGSMLFETFKKKLQKSLSTSPMRSA